MRLFTPFILLNYSKNHQNVSLYGLGKHSSRLIQLVTPYNPLYDRQEEIPSNSELGLHGI